jgi:hypothetical protein
MRSAQSTLSDGSWEEAYRGVLLNRPPEEMRRKIRMRERLRKVSKSRVGSGNWNPVRLPVRIRSGTKFSQEENEIGSRIENLASNEKSVASREHQSSPLKTNYKPRSKTRSSTTTKAKWTTQVKCKNKIFSIEIQHDSYNHGGHRPPSLI